MKLSRRLMLASSIVGTTMLATSAWAQDSSTLQQIQSNSQLRIGVTSAEPWFFKDPLTDQWSGVGIGMGERLAEELGVEMIPVETTWANAVASLQANQIDIMFVLDPTEERRNAIDFPEAPLFYYAMGALVSNDSAVQTWEDLDQAGTRIGVTLGTSLDRNVTEMVENAEINRFSNNDEAIAAFAAGRVNVVVQFHPALVMQQARVRMGKVILPEPVGPVATSAGVRKETDPEFRDWVSEQFASLYEQGVPDEIFVEYLESRGVDTSNIPGLVAENWE